MPAHARAPTSGATPLDAIVLSSDDDEINDELGALPPTPIMTHRVFVQSFTTMPSWEEVLQNITEVSEALAQRQRDRKRYRQIPNNCDAAVKNERVERCWDAANDVAPDAVCAMCLEPRGRKKSKAWRSPCCGMYACHQCVRKFSLYPHKGVCEACTSYAKAHGGKRHVPVGGPPGQKCTCVYHCPQKCDVDVGMRSFKMEQQIEAEAEAAARAAAAAAEAEARAAAASGSGAGRGTKRRRQGTGTKRTRSRVHRV